jgi:DNA repair protein RadD
MGEGAEEVYGDTNSNNRAGIVESFKNGAFKYLVNCGVFTTGFNVPDVDAIVLLRATMSPGLYVQMVGRGLRRAEGKTDCLILDYGKNIERLGPIDDVLVMPTGDRKKKTTWECPQCGKYHPYRKGKNRVDFCDECLYQRPVEEVEREKRIDAVSSSHSIIGQTERVEDVIKTEFRIVQNKSGKPQIQADYQISLFSTVSEYFQLQGPGVFYLKKFLEKVGIKKYENELDLIHQLRELKISRIYYVKDGKFNRITKYE